MSKIEKHSHNTRHWGIHCLHPKNKQGKNKSIASRGYPYTPNRVKVAWIKNLTEEDRSSASIGAL